MDYNIKTDVRSARWSASTRAAWPGRARDPWWNQSLCRVNDCVARLGVFEGEFHWHKHDLEDEVFFVLEGHLYLDLEGRVWNWTRSRASACPKGVLHRTRAPKRTVVLMIEAGTVKPTGD